MIWIVPFLWITILKVINKPTTRSSIYSRKPDTANDGTDPTWWPVGFYSFFHGSGFSSKDQNPEHGNGGHDGFGGYDYGGGADSSGFGGGDGGGD